MDWEDWIIWRDTQIEMETWKAETLENLRLREEEEERDYFAQFDND